MCTAEQVQGPATVAGVLIAPLFVPFLAFTDDCEFPGEEALGFSTDGQGNGRMQAVA